MIERHTLGTVRRSLMMKLKKWRASRRICWSGKWSFQSNGKLRWWRLGTSEDLMCDWESPLLSELGGKPRRRRPQAAEGSRESLDRKTASSHEGALKEKSEGRPWSCLNEDLSGVRERIKKTLKRPRLNANGILLRSKNEDSAGKWRRNFAMEVHEELNFSGRRLYHDAGATYPF